MWSHLYIWCGAVCQHKSFPHPPLYLKAGRVSAEAANAKPAARHL